MVVAGGDAPPILEPAEHALDAVSLLVAFGLVFDGLLAVLAAGDARLHALIGEGLSEAVAVVAAIRDQDIGVRQRGQLGRRPAIVADLGLPPSGGPVSVLVHDGFELLPPFGPPCWRSSGV